MSTQARPKAKWSRKLELTWDSTRWDSTAFVAARGSLSHPPEAESYIVQYLVLVASQASTCPGRILLSVC